MSGQYIINAAPMVIDLGAQDLSTVQVPRVADSVPQHLPKFYLYTQKGPTTPQLVSGAERINMYGQASFDYPGAYANHATEFSNLVDAQGNAQMIQRIVPTDAGPPANFLLSLDVLPGMVPEYTRNVDGTYLLDANGNPTSAGTTVSGYSVMWTVSSQATSGSLNSEFGTAVTGPGLQTSGGVQSQSYPILEFQASSQGAWGNLTGIRMWAPVALNNVSFPATMMDTLRTYPLYFSMVEAPDSLTTPSIVPTLLTDQYVQVVLKPSSTDPTTGAQLYVGDVLLQSYQNTTDPTYPPVFGNFSQMAVYQSNIDTLVEKFYTSELPVINSFSDITTNPNDKYLMNIASFVSSQNVPYTSVVVATSGTSVVPSQYTNIMAKNGSDGTMSDVNFNASVANYLNYYLDPTNEVQDIARNVESIFYDSGYMLATKEAMCAVVSQRHDTFVVLSTYDATGPILTQAQEMSMAISLRTRLQMYPESTYFGTPVMRGMIVGYTGTLLNSTYTKPLPLSAEIAIKSAIYMGASNGAWKPGSNFDGAPGSVLQYMVNPSIQWLPGTVRNQAWGVGLNWVQSFDRRSVFFPAYKTVYDNDTSVLNSYFTAMAICQLNKVAHAAWRQFSGVSNLTDIQLAEKTNSFINESVHGKFDGRFVIRPSAFYTNADTANGFSWTVPIKIYASNMKTVMTTYVQAYRMSSLSTTAA